MAFEPVFGKSIPLTKAIILQQEWCDLTNNLLRYRQFYRIFELGKVFNTKCTLHALVCHILFANPPTCVISFCEFWFCPPLDIFVDNCAACVILLFGGKPWNKRYVFKYDHYFHIALYNRKLVRCSRFTNIIFSVSNKNAKLSLVWFSTLRMFLQITNQVR